MTEMTLRAGLFPMRARAGKQKRQTASYRHSVNPPCETRAGRTAL